ncbi:MAG: hypothetical protein ABSD75_15475 [Terriglobales bacterium]|jgi:hypothetical protein
MGIAGSWHWRRVENCISALRFLYKKTLNRRDLAFDDLTDDSVLA